MQAKMTAIMKTAKPKESEPKHKAVTKPAIVKPKKKLAINIKIVAKNPSSWWKTLKLPLP
jgi:hypothetical protein